MRTAPCTYSDIPVLPACISRSFLLGLSFPTLERGQRVLGALGNTRCGSCTIHLAYDILCAATEDVRLFLRKIYSLVTYVSKCSWISLCFVATCCKRDSSVRIICFSYGLSSALLLALRRTAMIAGKLSEPASGASFRRNLLSFKRKARISYRVDQD